MSSLEPPARATAAAPGGPRRATVAFIFVTVLIDVLAIGLIIPVLPRLVEQFMGGDTARAASVYGVFGTAWALMQFLCSPILGSLSDRFGRRTVILLSCLGLGLDYVFMALAPSLGWLFVGRIISGITAASFSTSLAYIADVTPPEKRAASFGLMGAAFGLGFVLGPAVGGLLGGLSPRAPFWVSAVLALVNALYGWFVLPESLSHEHRRRFEWRRANPVGALAGGHPLRRLGEEEERGDAVGRRQGGGRVAGQLQPDGGEEPTDGRPEHEAHAESGAHQPEARGTPLRRRDVRDVRERRGEAGGGDARDETAHEQPAERRRKRHEHVVEPESEAREQDHAPAPEAVRERA